jgi:hypothetical protein
MPRQGDGSAASRATRNFETSTQSRASFAQNDSEEMGEIADAPCVWVIGTDGRAIMVLDYENLAGARLRISRLWSAWAKQPRL